MKALAVVGARPNFIKTAPVLAALQREPRCESQVLVHTGQHYGEAMSRVFFEELGIPDPAYNLEVGSGSHAEQTARVMTRLEPVLLKERPDVVLVAGDVNSTLAAAITATKLDIPVGHIEAGLRSFDRRMPEEINRVLTDAISSFLFIHSPEAVGHLLNEGAVESAIHDVGNTMIDTLVRMRLRIDEAARRLVDDDRGFYVVTLHRPALTDGPLLAEVVRSLRTLAEHLPVVFPIHPRTLARCRDQDLSLDGIELREPMGYIDFVGLVSRSVGVVTDSGGIQEEDDIPRRPVLHLARQHRAPSNGFRRYERSPRPTPRTHPRSAGAACRTERTGRADSSPLGRPRR